MEETLSRVLPLGGRSTDLVVELLRHGAASRTALTSTLDLSPASLTRLVAPLLDSGLLVEPDPVPHSTSGSGVGRPQRPVDVDADATHLVGVKVTGDHAYAVLTDLRATVLSSRRAALRSPSPRAVTSTVARLVAALTSDTDVVGVGVTVGGQVPDGRVVALAPFLGWGGPVALADLLEARTGLPVALDNDLVGLLRLEHWFAGASGLHSFALLTLGAGLGYGLVVHDQVVESVDPAQVARLPLRRDHDGVPTASALRSLVATVAATTGVERVVVAGEAVGAARALGTGAEHPSYDVEVRDHDWDQWARGAAVVGLRRHVLGLSGPSRHNAHRRG